MCIYYTKQLVITSLTIHHYLPSNSSNIRVLQKYEKYMIHCCYNKLVISTERTMQINSIRKLETSCYDMF